MPRSTAANPIATTKRIKLFGLSEFIRIVPPFRTGALRHVRRSLHHPGPPFRYHSSYTTASSKSQLTSNYSYYVLIIILWVIFVSPMVSFPRACLSPLRENDPVPHLRYWVVSENTHRKAYPCPDDALWGEVDVSPQVTGVPHNASYI